MEKKKTPLYVYVLLIVVILALGIFIFQRLRQNSEDRAAIEKVMSH